MKMTKIVVLFFFVIMTTVSAFADAPDDHNALKGVTSGKALFDINLARAEQVPLYLKVIGMTYEGLVKKGITPEFVVAFRGPSVQFIAGKKSVEDKKKALVYDEIAVKIRELKALGIHFEACAIATGLFHVDNSTVISEIRMVSNTFISLIGYQAKGYGIIPIM